MTQPNHPKFITKCPSIGGNMADRANLTKIEFGTLSREAENLHMKLEPALKHKAEAPVTWNLETVSRTETGH